MRALARVFLFLASAVWLAASSDAQTASNSVNIQFNFADFQQNPANVSQVKFTPIPTNGAVNGFLLHQEFPNFTRATAPSLTNGTLTVSNVLKGVVYETTFTARGREQTYYINADTNAADGTTIGAWTNVVAPTNLFGLFLSYLPNVPGSQVGYVPIATDTLGHYAWGPQTGGSGGGSGNVTGPVSSTAHHIAAFANTSGQLLEDAGYLASSVLPWANWSTNAFGAAAFKPTSFFDLTGSGTTAATVATNGYPWGVLYDAAGAAMAATNGLGGAAFKATNAFDLAGSWSAGTNGIGQAFTATNDARSLNLTNTANQLRGNHYGYFYETNADAGPGFQGLAIGKNTKNSFLTSGSVGNENLTIRLPPNGVRSVDDDNSQELWWFGKNHTVAPEDMAWRFGSSGTSTRNDASSTIMQGAPVTLEAPYLSGSVSSTMDQPARGPEMWNRKKHPWIGVHTAMTGESGGVSALNWRLYQKIYTNLPNVALWFRTSGVVSALSPYGVQIGVWGDTGAFTNRDSSGSLQIDPAILTASGITTVSNYTLALHTNGVKISLANYRTTTPVDVWKSDTGRVQTNGIGNSIGFPSEVVGNGPVWAVISPFTIDADILWYYTNSVDEIFLQNEALYTGLAGYEQQLEAFSYRSTFLNGSLGQHIYWKNYAGGGQISQSTFPGTGDFTNALVLGWFADHPNTQTPFMINDWTPNQTYAAVGTEPGLGQSMARLRTANDGMKDWPEAPVFPVYSIVNLGNSSSLSLPGITNTLAIAEMGRGNLFFEVDTNAWSWNTNLNPILTNSALFLSTWQDNKLWRPAQVFDDGTNSLWIRPIDNGAFLVLAANQSASSSNFNACLNAGTLLGEKGLATNTVYNATNVLSQDAFGTGYLTNNFIGPVAASSVIYIRLTPALPQTRVFAFDTSVTVGDTNRADGGHDYGVKANTGGSGTVTSVGLTMPSIFSVSGSPITGSGTIAVTANVNFETNNGAIASGSLLKSSGGSGATAATAGTDYLAPNGNGSALTSLTSANLTGTIPFAALPAYVLTNNSQGTFTNNILTNSGPASFAGSTTNFGNAYFKGSMNGSAAGLTNYADTNIVVSTNNWNWPGPTNNLDWARGTLQQYQPINTTALAITNFANFPVGQAASVVMWISNTNTAALNVKLPSPCETTNSMGGLTVSVNASNRLQILFQWSPLSTNALFSDQQLIK